MVVMLDEAHQFLNKSLSNDYDNFTLDAFDNIAKEGRKYGLFLGITTQMPRDIPVATLSQIGTFIVHRLINYRDKETIINALSNANRNILSYLPDLGVGEAILSCIELKMPLLIKVNQPNNKPDSSTPKLN
jgi:DNA helicase HerA-like ATPase